MERRSGQMPHEHIPTDQNRLIVKELYAAGVQKARIAKRLGICDETLNKHYEVELDNTKEDMIIALNKSLYQRALDGDEKAAEFWLKCQAGWAYAKAQEDIEKDRKSQSLMEMLMDKL